MIYFKFLLIKVIPFSISIAWTILLECLRRREEKERSRTMGVHLDNQQWYSWISVSLILV